MGHNPSNRDRSNDHRKPAVETRSLEEILKGIRGNLAAHLCVTPNDIQFLLTRYNAAVLENESLRVNIVRLNEQVDQFRTVYEQENRSTTFKIERVADPLQDAIEAAAENDV